MRTWLRIGLAAAITASVTAPTALMASDRFSDVPESNVFHNDIGVLAANQITLGCDSGGTRFCPDDNVTRRQMASFMVRLMGKADGIPPSVIAADSLHADEADFADTAGALSGSTTRVVTMSHGASVDLFAAGPLKFTGTCTDSGSGATTVKVFADTATDNVLLTYADGSEDVDFDSADPPVEIDSDLVAAAGESENDGYPAWLIAPDGSAVVMSDRIMGANLPTGVDCLVAFSATSIPAA